MKLTTRDLDTLRTLVIANDPGGYGQAAARLGRTPSAISLQMIINDAVAEVLPKANTAARSRELGAGSRSAVKAQRIAMWDSGEAPGAHVVVHRG